MGVCLQRALLGELRELQFAQQKYVDDLLVLKLQPIPLLRKLMHRQLLALLLLMEQR